MKRTYHLMMAMALMFFATGLKAQQISHFSQFILNDYVLNPAVGGTKPYFDVRSSYRLQWVGVDDAPKTFMLGMHGPATKKGNMGLGGYVYSDVTGPTKRTGFKVSYSYIFKVTETIKLSLGLAGGLMQYAIDGTEIELADNGDQAVGNAFLSDYTPDAAFGAYLFHEDFYVSLSIPQLIGTQLRFVEGYDNKDNTLKNHYYFNGGYRWHITDIWMFEPFVQMKYVPPTNPQVDIGGRVMYNDMIWLGGTFRTEDAASVFAGVQIYENFMLSYSYDIVTSEISSVSSGSHEIMLGLRFHERKD